ncbi:MAG TPA: lipid II flippase MurJ [Bacteroidales bacterium]|nr:lipid II flippase MurJ [Bacteroidales bacterium]
MGNQNGGLVKSTLLITFCSIFGIVISFASQLIIAYFFGAKFERDSYFVASTIPTYLAAIFTGSVGMVFLPKVVKIQNDRPNELTRFLSTVFWGITIFSTLIGILCLIFSENVLGFVANGFNEVQTVFTSKILFIILPAFVFNILNNLLSSLYQIQNRFLYPAFAPIITSVVSLLFVVLLSNIIGIFGLAWGFLAGSILSFIYLLPILKTYKIQFLFHFKDPEFLMFIRTFLPLLITGVVFRSTSIFERSIASGLEEGSISFLGYTSQILLIMGTLTANGIGVSIYPTISKLWAENKKSEFNIFFTKIIRILLLISVPISIVVIFYGEDFVKIVFERGAFDHKVTLSVSRALAWSTGAFIFQGLGTVVSKIFYITYRTTAISIIASIELLLYISIGFFLSEHISFVGLSIALSVSSMMNILLSIAYIHKRLIPMNLVSMVYDLFKILLASGASLFIVYLTYNRFADSANFAFLIVSLLLGGVSFYFVGILLKIEEMLFLKSKLSKLLNH